jgi:hypothetical protein
MSKQMWETDNGEVLCEAHLGMYATAALRDNPKRKIINTPLGRVARMSATSIADWAKFLASEGHTECCGVCRRAKR